MNMASAPDMKAVEAAIETLSGDLPERRQMTIHDNGGGNRINIMATAIRESDADGGDEVDQWWFAERGLLVVDLGGDDAEK